MARPQDNADFRFLISAHHLAQLPPDTGQEVAFAGRSNAGKSSAINVLTGVRGLARTSRTPGRTQALNLFEWGDPERRLMDLPGYGYAAVPLAVRKRWEALLERYLETRRSLAGLVLVMDARHPLKPQDRQMLAWADAAALPVHVLLTKADKLNRSQMQKALHTVRTALEALTAPATVQAFSATRRIGVDEARARLEDWLRPADEEEGEILSC